MTVKVCPRCREEKPLSAFTLTRRRTKAGFVPYRHSYCKPCRVEMQAIRDKRTGDARERLRELRRRMKLRRNYGISPEQYEKQLAFQRQLCGVCGKSLIGLSPQTIHIDHDHASGNLRGILCGACNVGLGSFRDDQNLLKAAALYLRRGGVWRTK